MELEKNSLTINQIVAQKLDSEICEGDCIVPDIKPDILKIIQTSGIVNIYKKEVMDGKIRIDGAINTYTMYLAEEQKREVRAINYVLDFSQIVNIENAKSSMNAEINTKLNSVESKIINERKINVKAMLEFDIKLFTNTSEEFITDIPEILDLQKMEKTIEVNSLVGRGRAKAAAKETIKIDDVDNLAEILNCNVEITNRDTKISYNKILAKADTKLKIMYLTTDGRINSTYANIPIMGFVDIQDISEENSCDVQYEIKNMILKPNGETEHSIYVEIEMEIYASAYEAKEINIVEDLYSPSKTLKFEQKKVKVMKNKMTYHDIYSVREKQILNIGNEKIYDANVKFKIDSVRALKGEIEINGNIYVDFIHSINNMQEAEITNLAIPIEYNMKCKEVNTNTNVKIETDIPMQDFTILPSGEVEIKIDVELLANTSQEIDINKIDTIKEENIGNEMSEYNMVIYFTKKDDSLWKIAKEYRSTMATIKENNELVNDEIIPGMQLFIPKYVGANG